MQRPQETLETYWNAMTGLALWLDFGGQRESFVDEIFTLSMRNSSVQEELCAKPKNDTDSDSNFAKLLKEGVKMEWKGVNSCMETKELVEKS